MDKYDFSGWATRNDLRCSDGRVIRQDAFKHCDGQTVPLVWNHDHSDPFRVIGNAKLENRPEGVYAYGYLNDSELGQHTKLLVQHGDINQLSIYANQLKQQGSNVIHGAIREVSVVMAGANPGALIDNVIKHGEESDEEAFIFTGEDIMLFHSDDEDSVEEETPAEDESIAHADEEGEKPVDDEKKEEKSGDEKTVADVLKTLNEEQQIAVYAAIGAAMENDDSYDEDDNSEGGNEEMKHNVFDNEEMDKKDTLTHSDEMAIIELAKNKAVGTWKNALEIYAEENELKHGFTDIEALFPDHQWVKPGAPEMITRDYTWIDSVLNRVHKSPISRIRMRHADLRVDDIRALGYEKGTEKKLIGSMKLINRSFDPQTVYVKDKIERDDMIDIIDFDVVAYQKNVMRMALNEELATAIMIGDGREEGDDYKIYDRHIQPIWTDNDLFTIHADVDIEAARQEIQGTDTSVHFGENYIYAEAIITAALYAREKYKGSGSLDFYCTPHLLNVMLLARDLNGRRIYNSKADLEAALNVNAIHTVEQFENKTRVTDDTEPLTKKLLGLFVNLSDYHVGSTKGGQITNFEDFDIDFNQYKYLMETRLSGALTKVFSAIALEEDVTPTPGGTE